MPIIHKRHAGQRYGLRVGSYTANKSGTAEYPSLQFLKRWFFLVIFIMKEEILLWILNWK